MGCDTTMNHMCSWGGSNTRCNRCQYTFCNYHKPINNGGASGGHQCVCQEGRKSASYGANCTKSTLATCPHCNQKVCSYHAPVNTGGIKGGHGSCSGPKCKTSPQFWPNCKGTTSKCDGCGDGYCAYHRKPGTATSQVTGGHVCPSLTNVGGGGSRHLTISPKGPFPKNAIVYFQRTLSYNTIRHQWVGVNWNNAIVHYEIAGECSGSAPNEIRISDPKGSTKKEREPNGPPEQCISFGPVRNGKSHKDIVQFKDRWLRQHPTYRLITDDCQSFTTDLLNFLGIENNRVPAGDASGLRRNNY